jgi:hypothetical protein
VAFRAGFTFAGGFDCQTGVVLSEGPRACESIVSIWTDLYLQRQSNIKRNVSRLR